ncbi:MAG: N-acetylmuramoyl-L-alanine amidase, partial [bacterium]|nr:N-acetylmuramoyl-L-alanine amidase [bacterium]
MTHRRLTCTLVWVCLAISCGGPPPPPSVDDVYRGLNEDVPRLDPSILANRRIVIDPGHGGFFPGTVGQDSLTEKGVNLGVSLYLWGLLKEAGADAILTRSADRDFLIESDSTLASDLQRRVEMVDSLRPDILISIHHNAQPARDSDKNAIETYYRFGDPASRDLAFAVHRHLTRNVGIRDGEVRPGNYYILRNVDVPAILGEGSYLTHRGVEKKLKLSEKQRLEAEAYFLGILDYFARGTPKLERTSPVDSLLQTVPMLAFNAKDVGGPGIDPGGVEMRINGQRVRPAIDSRGGRITYTMPWDSPNQPYDVSLTVRNFLGNTSRVEHVTFAINLPAENAVFEMDPSALPARGGTVRVRARLLDRRGLTVADGTTVLASASTGLTPDTLTVGGGFVEFPVTIRPGTTGGRARLDVGGRTFESALGVPSKTVGGYRQVVLVSALDGKPITNATVSLSRIPPPVDHSVEDSVVASGSQSGVYFLPMVRDPHRIRIVARGYRLLSLEAIGHLDTDTLTLEPWFGGVLIEKRFILDPEGGVGPGPGMGPLGLSGPFTNLRVAQYL